MIHKTITGFTIALLLLSIPLIARSESPKLSSKNGKTAYKYPAKKNSAKSNQGQTNLFNKHQQFHNKYYKSHQDFNNKYYKPHPGTKAYNQKYYGDNSQGKKHHHKNKHYNRYPHYGGNVYYGYNDYYYDDVPYEGYGSTLGTVPQRPSNLDVNNYVYGPDYDIYPEDSPRDVYEYQDSYSYGPENYSYAPDPERGTIYIWTDESGVEHFVNDPDLIPEQFSGDVRVVDEY